MKKVLLVISLFCFGVSQAYADPNQCRLAKNDGYASINAYYNPRIKQVVDTIKEIKDSGGDPSSIAIKIGDKFYTLPEIEAKLRKEKNIGFATVDSGVDDCVAQVKPYQDLVDGFVDVTTGGIAKLLPGKMGFVDASDILAGYPLGGKNALIPKAREDILKSLGIGGKNNEIGKRLRDPLRDVRCIFGC